MPQKNGGAFLMVNTPFGPKDRVILSGVHGAICLKCALIWICVRDKACTVRVFVIRLDNMKTKC